MKKTGEVLRNARESKGLSLNEVALSIKISSKILKSIEDGNTDQLPAKTFLRGFVQSYATYLRLDPDSIMNMFYEEMGSTKPRAIVRTGAEDDGPDLTLGAAGETDTDGNLIVRNSSKSSSKPYDPLAPINQKSNTKSIVVAIIAIILIGLIIFTKKMIDKYSKEAQVGSVQVAQPIENPNGEVPNPETPESAATEADAAAAAIVGGEAESPTAANLPVSASPSTTAKPDSLPINSATTKDNSTTGGLSTMAPKATPVATPLSSPTPSAAVLPKPAPTATASNTPAGAPVGIAKTPAPSNAAAPTVTEKLADKPTDRTTDKSTEKPADKPVELIIEAYDNVEIIYSSNAGKTTSLKLNSEQVHTFKSKNGLKLNISNGGAVNLILNGRDLGIPGDLGKPIKLSY